MANSYETSEFRNGLKVELEGNPYTITYFQFVKPGKGTAFTRTKLKNLITGAVIERTFRTGERLDAADVEEQEMEYLFNDGEFHHFMNKETFEQVAISSPSIEDEAKFLTENLAIYVLFYKGKPISITLPPFIESKVVYTEPAVKGNTSQGATKLATLACGASIQVPLFVDQDEVLRVDTRTGEYVARVK